MFKNRMKNLNYFRYEIELFEFTNETRINLQFWEKAQWPSGQTTARAVPQPKRHGLNPNKTHSGSHPTNQLNFSTMAQNVKCH